MREVVIDKGSDYNVKRFDLGGITDVAGPIKTIDGRHITLEMLKDEMVAYSKIGAKVIIEIPKHYKAGIIKELIKESDNKKIADRFGYSRWLSNYTYAITPVFTFNPYREFDNIEEMSVFFNQYYAHAGSILFVPNLHTYKTHYSVVISRTGKPRPVGIPVQQTTLEEYKKFVEESYNILASRNNKPIFLPFSLKLSGEEIKALAEHYIKNEHYYIWLDFEHEPSTSPSVIWRLRQLRDIFEKAGVFDKTLFHATNIRREISSHKDESESPSSDVLTSVIGVNIIGVNREPQRKIDDAPKLTAKQLEELRHHKARLLDPKTYYYKKVESMQMNDDEKRLLSSTNRNITRNARILNKELITQKEQFFDKATIKPYISDKKMIKEYENGKLVQILFEKTYGTKKGTMKDFI
jgi:hypothetical protein